MNDPSTESTLQDRIRPSGEQEQHLLRTIINSAATRYRGAIPEDCWHEPYMSAAEIVSEIAAGVAFHGYETAGKLVGVMGVQSVGNVDLIRHAYVLPSHQSLGIGSQLLDHLCARTTRPILIGTWAAASWAIRFYERHGFERVPACVTPLLLKTYWSISARQVETSVVLARPRLNEQEAQTLVDDARDPRGKRGSTQDS